MIKQLTIVIPAYNEENSLKTFLPEVLEHCENKNYNLIVVNDGSKDKTLDVLNGWLHKSSLFKVVSHKLNKGYGAAIKTGIGCCETEYIITIDADGQHYLEDIDKLLLEIEMTKADMVVGNRGSQSSGYYRSLGKWLIRKIARVLMPLKIVDINSGIKIYNTELAKKYIRLCPNTMAYSDIITLFFISQRHLVIESAVRIRPRKSGISTINTRTALETIKEILNIVVLFYPMKIFLPLSLFSFLAGAAWGIPILLMGRGLSVGALLGITTAIIFFLLGLLAEQLSLLRKENL